MKVFIFSLFLSGMAYAETQVYLGEAILEGRKAYTEKHEVKFDAGKVASSVTEYTDPKGAVVGKLTNDYARSLNAPEYTMVDVLNKNKHGIRYVGDKLTMFTQDDGEKEEVKVVDKEDFEDKLVVAGQGLHYYLVTNLEEVIKKGKIDLLFLIPGRLDAYDFCIEVVKKSEDSVYFEIEIKSWILKAFAPKLKLFYTRKKPRLIKYSGLSNIKDDKNKMMNIDINYQYRD